MVENRIFSIIQNMAIYRRNYFFENRNKFKITILQFRYKIEKSQIRFKNRKFTISVQNRKNTISVQKLQIHNLGSKMTKNLPNFGFEYAIFDRYILNSGILVFFKDYETALFISGLDY